MEKNPVLYCGDTHGQHEHVIDAAIRLEPSAVVLLGDMTPSRMLDEELDRIASLVWFVHGNHDTDSDEAWSRIWESKLADRNIDGRVVELPDGTRLAGLGGVFRAAVWNPGHRPAVEIPPIYRNRKKLTAATPRQDRWHGGPHRRHWSSIYPDDFDHLAKQRADVLITHEAPGYHPMGFDALDALARGLRARVTVHGHQHDRLDSSALWGSQGFASHGVGLRGITAIDADGSAEVIVPGQLDEQFQAERQRLLTAESS